MVAHFSFDEPKKVVIEDLRYHLEESGFVIKEYAPEDAFLFTDFKLYDWGTGRRLLAVAVHVNDKITITGMGKMDVPVSDLGPPEDLMKIKEVICIIIFAFVFFSKSKGQEVLKLPKFSLLGVDNKTYTQDSLLNYQNIAVIFYSNYCRVSQKF